MANDYTIYIDDVDIRSFGVGLQRPATFTGIVPIVQSISIPGRNGNLIFDTGAYENRTGAADCFVLHDRVDLNVGAITSFLLEDQGYRKLQTSEDPNHYWMARITNGVAIQERLNLLNPFTITFDCKPQRWLVEDTDLEINVPSDHVGDYTTDVFNPGSGHASPLLCGNTTFGFEVTINDIKVKVDAYSTEYPDDLYVDCEIKNAYAGAQNVNNCLHIYKGLVSSTEFPAFKPGNNTITLSSGTRQILIKPRWWDK